MIVTHMMMSLTRLLPKELPTTFGTPELVDQARAAGRRRVELVLPPVDVHLNATVAVHSMRASAGISSAWPMVNRMLRYGCWSGVPGRERSVLHSNSADSFPGASDFPPVTGAATLVRPGGVEIVK